MDLRTLGGTFLLVFLAELGDKTQLATFGLAAGDRSRLAVFLGAALALITTSAIAVLLGGIATRIVPERVIRGAAGAIFLVLGALLVLQALKPGSIR